MACHHVATCIHAIWHTRVHVWERVCACVHTDGYYVAYKLITLSCILFIFIEMKFIDCHSCVMFAIKSMSMCNY